MLELQRFVIVRNPITRHPKISIKKLTTEINVAKSTKHRILRIDFLFKP